MQILKTIGRIIATFFLLTILMLAFSFISIWDLSKGDGQID
ncbi:MAG TPA: hypothetical protein VM639_00095 [Dongiaceae bacterium]|nr:hypothetical protein [Dongiaceae bacterium]